MAKSSPRPVEINPAVAHNLEAQRLADRKMVRGKFIFHEVPNGSVDLVFKKYKDDPLEKFSLRDGQIYTIPLGVAKHLNTNVCYPIYKNTVSDVGGQSVLTQAESVRRTSFQSLEFFDIDDKSLSPL